MQFRLPTTLLLVSAVVLAYGNTLRNGFALDDGLYIFRNPAVTSASIAGWFEPHKEANVFRPFTFATLALNWTLGGAHPWGYHLFNLVLHAAVVLLLYRVLCKLFETQARGPTLAFVAAALFAVHPIHTDAVSSVVGRSELLAAGFVLAAWLLHLDDKILLSLACFVLALLSKESALAFVPLTLAGDYVRGRLKPLFGYCCAAGVALVYVSILWNIQGGRFGQKQVPISENPLILLPVTLRVVNAVRIAWKYIALHVYPARLSCDYSFNSIPLYATWVSLAPAVIAALAVLALWIWSFCAKRNEWFLCGAIYLAGFAVTANIFVPTGTIMAERLAYLPSAGFCLLCSLLWWEMHQYQPRLAWGMLCVLLACLGTRTVIRNFDWRDNFTLFSAAERAFPENASIHDGLAGEYTRRGANDRALAETETTVRIYPDYPEEFRATGVSEKEFRLVNIAVSLMRSGENADATRFLNLAIAGSPNFSLAWSNRALISYESRDFRSARADAQNALQLDPGNFQARYVLEALRGR